MLKSAEASTFSCLPCLNRHKNRQLEISFYGTTSVHLWRKPVILLCLFWSVLGLKGFGWIWAAHSEFLKVLHTSLILQRCPFYSHAFFYVPEFRNCVIEVDVLGLSVPNSPYGFCRRKATLNKGNPTLSMAGSSASSVVERWTCDQKVESSSPCRSSGKMVFSGVNVLC